MAEYGTKEYWLEQLEKEKFKKKTLVMALKCQFMTSPFMTSPTIDEFAEKLIEEISLVNGSIKYYAKQIEELENKEKGKSE